MNDACDVAVVGAGPAGLMAAIEAARAGLSVTVVDEFPWPGGRLLGQLYLDPRSHGRWDGRQISRRLAQEAGELGVRILGGATVWAIGRDLGLELAGVHVATLRPQALLLATGAAERALPVPGWTKPGVVTVGAAQTFTNVHHVAIGRRVLVAGIDPLALSVAMEMHHAGIDVVGVVLPPVSPTSGALASPERAVARLADVADLAPNGLLRAAARLAAGKLRPLAVSALRFDLVRVAGVPVGFRTALVAIEGDGRVESATLRSVAPDGTLVGPERRIEVDAVCLSAGLYPLTDLAEIAGCPMVEVEELGGLVPLHGPGLETPLEHLFVAGNLTGIEGAKVAMAQGRLAGCSIARSLGRFSLASPEDLARAVSGARTSSPFRFQPRIAAGRAAMTGLWQQAIAKGDQSA